MRKKIFVGVLVLVLALVSLTACSSQQEKSGMTGISSSGGVTLAAVGSSQSTGLWVTGEGKVTAAPDLILLSLGIESKEDTVAAAQAKATVAMNDIKQILLAQGVAEKDIQTQYFNIGKVTRWDPNLYKEEITGYQVSNTVIVKVRELDKAGPIIDAVTAAAGDLTRINSITFTIDDPTDYYDQAREEAVQDAIAKAKQVAGLAEVTLGKPIYISIGTDYSPAPMRKYDSLSEMASGANAVTSISPGELELQTTVSVVFSMD